MIHDIPYDMDLIERAIEADADQEQQCKFDAEGDIETPRRLLGRLPDPCGNGEVE